MSTMQSRDAKLQEFMQVYELRLACNECTHRRSSISYSFLSVPHQCVQDLMLVKAKVKGHRWSPLSNRPSYPRPSRYEVCWFFKEDVGCYVHRERCTFARSAEEAAVWNLQKQLNLDLKSLILLINQTEKLNEQSRQWDARSSSQSPSSYKEKLLEEYRKSSNEILTLSQQVDDVYVTQDQNLCLDCLKTCEEITWRFKITTERSLEHVALLKVERGAVFSLGDNVRNTFPPLTYTTGHHLRSSHSTYELSVCFLSFLPGVYEQWLVLDFDIRPVLLRILRVRVGKEFHAKPDEEENECSKNVWNERWDRGNRVIVPFFNRKKEDELELLLSKYKPPQINLQFSFYTDHSSPLHQDNYRERAHDFLFREEIAEEKLIRRLNVCGLASLSELNPSPFFASWRLCARLKVSCSLTPDTPEGLMLKRGVRTALLNIKTANTSESVKYTNRVYEALVFRQAADENHIVLELSSNSVSELQLRKETSCEMEVQFQLDRLWFCQMHQAVDHLTDLHTVLPELSHCCVPVNTTKQYEMNNKQQIALNFILGKCEASEVAAPLLIYGPFGTGKTHCLASAAIQLALQPKTKVLICTHTNSSADLYVRVHFHPYITNGHPNLKILRIKANKGGAPIMATDDITRKYCLFSADGQSFIFPTSSQLESHRIIITTTSMARRFRELNLPSGFFSHILIDEASQMLETEAVMALGLANKQTRVVLAGDHMQMAPKLFSITNDKHSDHTMLNRLFRYYQDHSSNIAKKSRIIFNENYRSTSEIVDFVSTHFYVSDGIKAKGDVSRHPKLYPLMFHHVRGECLLNPTSLSWYNHAEVTCVINVIQELVTHWPVEWGEREPKQICVLSEGKQVEVIRNHLRSKELHRIQVQNLANIQGMQFRVIIITTVQTRNTLLQSESSCLEFFNDVHALNTAITRAQSLVVVVGDAGALCCFGKCSRIWKSYVGYCISNGSAKPDYFNSDVLEQEVSEVLKFKKTEKVVKIEDDVSLQPETDLILKEMIEDYNMDSDSDDENEVHHDQKSLLIPASEKDLLELVRERPIIYRQGELVMETYNSGYVVPYDNPTIHIAINGRKNIGPTFPGDEVVLETGLRNDEGYLTGKVLGVTNRATASSTFVCFLENRNYRKTTEKTEKSFLTKIMIPICSKTTKICICVSKKTRNFLPIWKFHKGNWEITRYFPLDEHNIKDFVFVVQIFTWKAHCSIPLGNVTDVLPIGTTLEEGLEILKLEYQLMPSPLMQKVAASTTKRDVTDYSKRTDLTGLKTFTVDPEGARDLDDAISAVDLGDCYEIGVHVADVASFVPKGSHLDSDAKERGATYYKNGGKPFFSMFPKHLTDLCSLIKDKERPAISLILKVEKESGIIKNKDFKLSVIKSKKQLSYEEAENITSRYNGELKFDTLEDCVRVAYHFARTQRKVRLKESWTYAQPDQHRKPGERESHLMIEELNIMFNHEMSDFLTKNTNTEFCTPLRCQNPPTAEQLKEIYDQNAEVIHLSNHLMYHLNKNHVDQHDTNFLILTSVWEKIESAALTCDFYKMTDLISTDDIHPQLRPVIVQLNAGLGKAFLTRSLSSVGHFSLHLDTYTQASSPIRRYTDVVVQRLVHSVLDNHTVEYSESEIDQLCNKCERGEDRSQQFESQAESLCLAVSLQTQSTYKLAVVTVVLAEHESFILSFPFDQGTYPDRLPVMYRDLKLQDQPIFNKQQKQMRLTWKKRMYSMSTTNSLERNIKFCSEIQQSTWHAIIEAVREERWEEAKSLILTAEVIQHSDVATTDNTTDEVATTDNTTDEVATTDNTTDEVATTDNTTDEVADNSKLDPDHTSKLNYHYVNFTLNLKAGDTLQVQLTSERKRGYWGPTVQLLSVRSNIEICLEHTHSPIKCFSKDANHSSKPSYEDVDDYVQIWKPLCEMESATTAVDDSDCVVIDKVHIDWKQSLVGNTSSLSGTFSLPLENLKKWAIEFDLAKCFLCIRKRVSKPNSAQSHQSDVDPDYFTWVAHGVTTQCSDIPSKKKSKSIHFSIKYASMNLPKDKRDTTYTVEVIPKLLPDIRKESAVNNLPKANELVKNIALGHRIGKAGSEPAVKLNELKKEPIPAGLPELNDSQFKALDKALNDKFTLIQGPPGTGKTVVGAYIVYWFSRLNSKKPQTLKELKDKEKKEVILYCGPSNKSVDVVAEYLLRFGDKLKQLRVYSRQMEMQEFPYPGSNLQVSQKSVRQETSKPELREITLHHRIRKSHNPHAQAILDFDKRNKIDPESITDEDIEEYKKLLNSARLYELERHDVILCTCTAAASPNLVKSLSARQILIDECAMATEPQTLVPLVSFKPEKVVLLGDHKQLRPIVKNMHVRKLGMTRTLFERYISRAGHTMLDIQYRMHEDICRFPSEAYYQSKLKTCVVERASKLHATTENTRQSKHILFGDIRGDEISLVVSTARGNQKSKVNCKEADKAVDICIQLISVGDVSPEDIAILSPYNAQVAHIKDKLKERLQIGGSEKTTVTTITKSQGSEWRYVILSMVRSCNSEEIEHFPSGEWLSEHIGFVGDENQINVGITRAQEGLCILGNQELLNCSRAWRKLLHHYLGHSCVVSAEQITVHKVH